MRRVLASLLLALFSFTLMLPALRPDADANLPACCRRAGKHRCAMGSGVQETGGMSALQPKCADYPSTIATPQNGNAAWLKASPAISASLLGYPALAARAETQYRISFSRCRQKRGPPALFS